MRSRRASGHRSCWGGDIWCPLSSLLARDCRWEGAGGWRGAGGCARGDAQHGWLCSSGWAEGEKSPSPTPFACSPAPFLSPQTCPARREPKQRNGRTQRHKEVLWTLPGCCTHPARTPPGPQHPNGRCWMPPRSRWGRGFPPEPAARAHRQTPRGVQQPGPGLAPPGAVVLGGRPGVVSGLAAAEPKNKQYF